MLYDASLLPIPIVRPRATPTPADLAFHFAAATSSSHDRVPLMTIVAGGRGLWGDTIGAGAQPCLAGVPTRLSYAWVAR